MMSDPFALPSSDDESEELKMIRDKLEKRPPTFYLPSSSDDNSSISSTKETSVSLQTTVVQFDPESIDKMGMIPGQDAKHNGLDVVEATFAAAAVDNAPCLSKEGSDYPCQGKVIEINANRKCSEAMERVSGVQGADPPDGSFVPDMDNDSFPSLDDAALFDLDRHIEAKQSIVEELGPPLGQLTLPTPATDDNSSTNSSESSSSVSIDKASSDGVLQQAIAALTEEDRYALEVEGSAGLDQVAVAGNVRDDSHRPTNAEPQERLNSNLMSDASRYPINAGKQEIELSGIEPDERIPEIHPSLYAPPPHRPRSLPLVHHFTTVNRPMESRSTVAVSQIFESPANRLWQTKFDQFNQLQSELANTLAYSDDNIVVSAPTGAGKTAVFEMTMARLFSVDLKANIHRHGSTSPCISKQRKIVYVSPSKALCEERYEDWSQRFSRMNLGLEISLVTGDGDPSESFRRVCNSHVILTTPEKWDSLTRRWTESFFLFGSVKLFLVDEVHLLADGSRGVCLEAVICRMKTIQRAARQVDASTSDIQQSSYPCTSPEAINGPMRIVAVSATLPNIAEIAAFVEANEAYVFDESYRPVPLTTHVIGQGFVSQQANSQFRFWRSLDRNVPELIHRFSKNRPTIIFCHSKAETEKLADHLVGEAKLGSTSDANRGLASQTKVTSLQRVLFHGVAYHHAGLEIDDRRLVEKGFSNGNTRILCCTSTLACGVNLPAHLVIIKGTKAWRGGGSGYQDIDQASLLQMIGRAGRPGFDTSGTAIIMTDNNSKSMFQRLASSGLNAAKSQLTSKLDELVNAEISQNVISSTETALNWIKTTLYYVQLASDPTSYGIEVVSEHSVDTHLLELCRASADRLTSIQTLVAADGQELVPTNASHIMSQNLVDYQSMRLIVNLPFDSSQCQTLKMLAAMECLHRPVRRSEKKTLNELQKTVKYKLEGPPSKIRVQEPSEKAFVLLQASIGQIHLEDFALRQEMHGMVEFASRTLSAIEDYAIKGSKHGHVAFQSLKLRRSLAVNLWDESGGVLTQLSDISSTIHFGLKLAGISSFEAVLNASAEQLEKAANRYAPFGNNLRAVVLQILASSLKLSASIEYAAGSDVPSHIVCNLQRPNDPRLVQGSKSRQSADVTYTLIAYTDRPGGCILYRRNLSQPQTFKVAVPSTFGSITLHLVASMIGLDEQIELEGNDSLAPSTIFNTKRKASGHEVPVANTGKGRESKKNDKPSRSGTTTDKSGPAKKRFRGVQTKMYPPKKQLSKSLGTVTPSPRSHVPYSRPCEGAGSQTDANAHRVEDNNNTYETTSRFAAHNMTFKTDQVGIATRTVAAGLVRMPSPPIPPNLPVAQNVVDQYDYQSAITVQTRCHQPSHCGPTNVEPAHAFKPNQAHDTQHHDLSHSNLPHRSMTMSSPFQTPYAHTSQQPQPSSHLSTLSTVSRSTRQLPSTQTTWKNNKRQQIKSQQRAFTNKRDNPFSLYRHDPNDSESYLDALSSQNANSAHSVIPPEGYRALADAYRQTGYPAYGAPHIHSSGRKAYPTRQRGRRQQQNRLQPDAILEQKAAEQAFYQSSGIFSPSSTDRKDTSTSPYSSGNYQGMEQSNMVTGGYTNSARSPVPPIGLQSQFMTEPRSIYTESWKQHLDHGVDRRMGTAVQGPGSAQNDIWSQLSAPINCHQGYSEDSYSTLAPIMGNPAGNFGAQCVHLRSFDDQWDQPLAHGAHMSDQEQPQGQTSKYGMTGETIDAAFF